MSLTLRSHKDEIHGATIQVICRIRPPTQKDIAATEPCIRQTNNTIEYMHDGHKSKFEFDKIFGPDDSQTVVFEESVRPLINDVVSGYNCTVFAYGQSGAGKVLIH